MDSVFINGMSVYGNHGVSEEERSQPQEFIIDVAASFDAHPASVSDVLADTIDYIPLSETIKSIVERDSYMLIERLAERIAGHVLEDTRIHEVRVTVRKPAAMQNGRAGVTIVRTNS